MNTALNISNLDHHIGRLFMIGMPGTDLDKNSENLIRDYNIGGIILFSRNIKDPLQLAKLCADIKAAAMKYHGSEIFIATDQEGGNVARLKEPFSIFPGNEELGKDTDPKKKAVEFAEITAREMRMVGLNMDLAPVMDVRRGNPDDHLRGRIFSDNPGTVAMLGGIVIDTLQKKGIMAVAKHFPGLGMADFDPHKDRVTIHFRNREIQDEQLIPFISSIKNDVSGIMTSHAIYPSMDTEYPGTLSKDILTGLLRKELKYKGLILTDDLEMGAISKSIGVSEGAVASFRAGADVLLICKDRRNVIDSIKRMKREVLTDDVMMSRMLESLERINSSILKYLHSGRKISMAAIKEYFKIEV